MRMGMEGEAAHLVRLLSGAAWRQSVPAEPLSGSRPPDQVFERIPRHQLESILADANRTGDLGALDGLDNFRQTLPPARQAEYDGQLEALRDDPRIQFVYADGAMPDPAMEDMMLRGILAATFGREGLLDAALEARVAAGQDNVLQVVVYPGDVPVADLGAQGIVMADPLDGAVVTPAGDILVDNDFMLDCLEYGENTLLHEFGHVLQYGGQADAGGTAAFPDGFPAIDVVVAEFQSPEFQALLQGMPYGALNGSLGGETFATLLNVFRQYPGLMRDTSPEMYAAFVEYYGVDPFDA